WLPIRPSWTATLTTVAGCTAYAAGPTNRRWRFRGTFSCWTPSLTVCWRMPSSRKGNPAKAQYVLAGGHLGAGKTTAVSQLASTRLARRPGDTPPCATAIWAGAGKGFFAQGAVNFREAARRSWYAGHQSMRPGFAATARTP